MERESGSERAFVVLVCVFVGCLTIASVLADKILSLYGLFVPAGVLAYSVTFVCTDTIGEIWGAGRSRSVVLGGFVALLFVLVLVQIGIAWPSAPFWERSEAFESVLGSTSRIIVASFAAYLFSQFHDIWAFHFWRRVTNQKHLWLRNNLSTAASQLLDSTIFIAIAFYGVLPIWPLVFGQWIVKLAISVADTPIVYLLVWLLRRK